MNQSLSTLIVKTGKGYLPEPQVAIVPVILAELEEFGLAAKVTKGKNGKLGYTFTLIGGCSNDKC
jgi:hypothetical protein